MKKGEITMTYFDKVKLCMIDDGCDINFKYNNKNCGVYSNVKDSVFYITSWFGNVEKDYVGTDKMFDDPFFDGHSLKQLINERKIEIDFC